MNHKDNGKEIDFEIDIAKRMDSLIARKRSENELVIARIATLEAILAAEAANDGGIRAGVNAPPSPHG
jgi:BMFP domain-containing protein YqiC